MYLMDKASANPERYCWVGSYGDGDPCLEERVDGKDVCDYHLRRAKLVACGWDGCDVQLYGYVGIEYCQEHLDVLREQMRARPPMMALRSEERKGMGDKNLAAATISSLDGVEILDNCLGHARYESAPDCITVRYDIEFAGMADHYGCKPIFTTDVVRTYGCCTDHSHEYDMDMRSKIIGALADAGLTARDVGGRWGGEWRHGEPVRCTHCFTLGELPRKRRMAMMGNWKHSS